MARVVVVEDESYLRSVLTMWISRGGHDVIGAADGEIALECLRTQPVDVLITDVRMPGIDGVELTRRALAVCSTLQRVFVITSVCDKREVLDQLPDPRVRVFPKPFSPSRLRREVDLVARSSVRPHYAVASAGAARAGVAAGVN